MSRTLYTDLNKNLQETRNAGLFKEERVITSQQQSHIQLDTGKTVLNFCANNYLGLANHPSLIEASSKGIQKHGYGVASVRFICGTQDIHKNLEKKVSEFMQTEDTILYGSCFDANGGLFETLLGPEDAIISDELNHASIIDGIRLCKAERHRYKNNDMSDLEEKLKKTQNKRYRMIATDGVFSMDGIIANLSKICELAEKYDALVMCDDCHATGFLGQGGKGTSEYCNVLGKVDIITSTLGKGLGGASGGFTTGKKVLIDWLRQRSRPYLFSNSLMPGIVEASLQVFNLLEDSKALREKLWDNSAHFRKEMEKLGFTLSGKDHPIIPVMIGDAQLAQDMASELLNEGVYVIGFSYPVVPLGKARIRTQISAAHSKDDINQAIKAFEKVGKKLQII